MKVPGQDLSIDNFKKLVDYYDKINFCGQLSDPIHHPKMIAMLKIVGEAGKRCSIHTASSFKSMEWFVEAFKANPKVVWYFGIDGLPKDSHQYRVNQDGEKLFEVMVEATKHLKSKPVWQYIVFKYNENDIDEAMLLADKHDIKFMLVDTNRYGDPALRPSDEKWT